MNENIEREIVDPQEGGNPNNSENTEDKQNQHGDAAKQKPNKKKRSENTEDNLNQYGDAEDSERTKLKPNKKKRSENTEDKQNPGRSHFDRRGNTSKVTNKRSRRESRVAKQRGSSKFSKESKSVKSKGKYVSRSSGKQSNDYYEDDSSSSDDGESSDEDEDSEVAKRYYQDGFDSGEEDDEPEKVNRDDDSIGGTATEFSEAEEGEGSDPDDAFDPRLKFPKPSLAERVKRRQHQIRSGQAKVSDPSTGIFLTKAEYAKLVSDREKIAEQRKNPTSRSYHAPTHNIQVLAGATAERLTKLDHDHIVKFRDNMLRLAGSDYTVKFAAQIAESIKMQISVRFHEMTDSKGKPYINDTDHNAWERWTPKVFIRRLMRAFPPANMSTTGSAEERIGSLSFTFTPQDLSCVDTFFNKVTTMLETDFTEYNDPVMKVASDKALVDRCIRKLTEGGATTIANKLKEKGKPTTVFLLWCKWEKHRRDIAKVVDFVRANSYIKSLLGFKADQLPFKDNNRSGKDKRNKDASRSDSNTRPAKKAARSSPDGLCTGCGRDNHPTEKCSFLIKKHPEANTSDKPWLQSEHGIAWKEKDQKVTYLPGGKLLDGSPCSKHTLPEG